MKLQEYNLPNWKEGKIRRQKKLQDKRILLLSTSGIPPREGERNLLAVNKVDEILWIAELPTEVYDSYTEMKFVDGFIRAESSNSFVSEIDPDTGKILKKYMVK